MFRFKVDTSAIYTGTRVTHPIRYNGIDIKVIIIIKIQTTGTGTSTTFGMYLAPKMDPADDTLLIDARFGFINRNGNMCRETAFNHTYTPEESNFGTVFHTTMGAVELSRVVQHYDVDNSLIFGLLLNDVTVQANDCSLLRRIYHVVNGSGVKALEDQITAQGQEIQRYIKLCAQLEEQALQLERRVRAQPQPQSPKEDSTALTQTPPATDQWRLDAELEKLDTDALLKLQQKITQLIQQHNRCSICLEEASTMIIAACGHKCCCEECSTRVDTCPICRGVIDKFIKVY